MQTETATSPKLKLERVDSDSTLVPEAVAVAPMEASQTDDFDQLESDYGEDEELDNDPTAFRIR